MTVRIAVVETMLVRDSDEQMHVVENIPYERSQRYLEVLGSEAVPRVDRDNMRHQDAEVQHHFDSLDSDASISNANG